MLPTPCPEAVGRTEIEQPQRQANKGSFQHSAFIPFPTVTSPVLPAKATLQNKGYETAC